MRNILHMYVGLKIQFTRFADHMASVAKSSKLSHPALLPCVIYIYIEKALYGEPGWLEFSRATLFSLMS